MQRKIERRERGESGGRTEITEVVEDEVARWTTEPVPNLTPSDDPFQPSGQVMDQVFINGAPTFLKVFFFFFQAPAKIDYNPEDVENKWFIITFSHETIFCQYYILAEIISMINNLSPKNTWLMNPRLFAVFCLRVSLSCHISNFVLQHFLNWFQII